MASTTLPHDGTDRLVSPRAIVWSAAIPLGY